MLPTNVQSGAVFFTCKTRPNESSDVVLGLVLELSLRTKK